MWVKLLSLALAGALGTVSRYLLQGLVHRLAGSSFPWGTFAVNACGCFLTGLLWTLFEHRWPASGQVRTLVLVGFMGAFTTFSSFILETSELMRAAEWLHAAGNLLGQNSLGFVALVAGLALGRLL
jgi:CrcB protein